MAPTSIHTILSRDNDPSLGELFHRFPASLWRFFKLSLFGLALILAFFGAILAVIFLFMWIYMYGTFLVNGLSKLRAREFMEEPRERIWRLRRIERLDRMWVWLKGGGPRAKVETVDNEELRPLDNHDGEGREGSVDGETLLDGEEFEDEGENGQASKKEGMELDSEGHMNSGT